MPGVTTAVDRSGCEVLTIRRRGNGVPKPRVARILAGFGAGACYGVHTNTLKNLARGVVERVFFVVRGGCLERPPQPRQGVFSRLSSLRRRLVRYLRPTTVVPREDYPLLHHGRKQAVYRRAVDSLRERAIERRDAHVKTFVKAEKVNLTAKPDPAPRVIQPRDPRYNVEVGRYLKNFERELCLGFKKAFGYRVICKGLNAEGTAAQLRENWDRYGHRAVAFGLDASRFDQHVSVEALEFEHSVYNSVFRSNELARLLRWQLLNKGVAFVEDAKVTYKVSGCRMSGDINTGMGNCLLMSLMVLGYFQDRGIDARLSNNGDDCVVICSEEQLGLFDDLGAWFLDFGFTLTREDPVRVFERIEFCQANPVWTASGWRMVRNPYTAPSKDSVSLLSWQTQGDRRTWASAIGTCGLELTRGVPFWEAYYRRLIEAGSDATQHGLDAVYDSGLGYMARGVSGCEVCDAARVSFYLAFGMTPDHQIALEDSMPVPDLDALQPMMSVSPHDIRHNTPLGYSKRYA